MKKVPIQNIIQIARNESINKGIGEIDRFLRQHLGLFKKEINYHTNDMSKNEHFLDDCLNRTLLKIAVLIQESDKMDKMEDWSDLKKFSLKIFRNIIRNSRRKEITRINRDRKIREPNQDINNEAEGGINMETEKKIAMLTDENIKMVNEIYSLLDEGPCKHILELSRSNIKNIEIMKELNELLPNSEKKYIRDEDNFKKKKNKCKKLLIKKVKSHEKYKTWFNNYNFELS